MIDGRSVSALGSGASEPIMVDDAWVWRPGWRPDGDVGPIAFVIFEVAESALTTRSGSQPDVVDGNASTGAIGVQILTILI